MIRRCEVDGCGRQRASKRYCQTHHLRWKRGKDMDAPIQIRDKQRGCSVESCDRQHSAKGLCELHYGRQRRGTDLSAPVVTVDPSRQCAVSECGKPHHAKGLCRFHYRRAEKNIPLEMPKYNAGRRWKDSNGYVLFKVAGANVSEHRHVMQQVLGRPLRSYENVHHINGIRDDNRPENLELWVKPQPCGQRPSDLAAWVVEHYPELVEAAQANRAQLRLAQ